MNDIQKERFNLLMTKALDGELAGSEQSEFGQFLRNDTCRREWKSYRKLQEATMSLRFKQPSTEMWDQYFSGVYNRTERGIAWILVTVGAAVLLVYAAIEAAGALWYDAELPVLIKAGIIAVVAGIALLLFSVIREKWFTRKHDKYKEVVR